MNWPLNLSLLLSSILLCFLGILEAFYPKKVRDFYLRLLGKPKIHIMQLAKSIIEENGI
jgi:hypothetical protein